MCDDTSVTVTVMTTSSHKNPSECWTYVMLFWWSVSRAVLRSSVVALLSMFLKRSMAEMFLWMLCLGRSSFVTNVNVPPSSQRKSMGQQSWPWCKENKQNNKSWCWREFLTTERLKHCVDLTAATRLFSETKTTLRSGRNSVFSCEGLNTDTPSL